MPPLTRDLVSRVLLGNISDPYAHFQPPADMAPNYWYGSVFARAHVDLAKLLVRHAGPDGYIVELGSFIGNSATVWANTAKAFGWSTPVVCIDTWLGDLVMWEMKGKLLGTPSATGQPRLYEQFMLNVIGANVSSHVVPMRLPAETGLRYLERRVLFGKLPAPRVIFLDTAHSYPETTLEMERAWDILAPGGYLTGDDYTHYFPPVQQAVNEFVRSKGVESFVWPGHWAAKWHGRQRMRTVALALGPGQPEALHLPLLLRLPGQWVLKKPGPEDAARDEAREAEARKFRGKGALFCCLNGWADPKPRDLPKGKATRMQLKSSPASYYTRCNQEATKLSSRTCELPANHTECLRLFRCSSPSGSSSS